MRPIVLVGHRHVCPLHGTGVVVSGDSGMVSSGKEVACIGHQTSCGAVIQTGSSQFEINGKGVARMGDTTTHGGVLVEGEENWQID